MPTNREAKTEVRGWQLSWLRELGSSSGRSGGVPIGDVSDPVYALFLRHEIQGGVRAFFFLPARPGTSFNFFFLLVQLFTTIDRCTSDSASKMEPPSKKARKLLDDDSASDSGDESGGVPIGKQSEDDGFMINEEYAHRFEHNKKREEMQKCTSLFSLFV